MVIQTVLVTFIIMTVPKSCCFNKHQLTVSNNETANKRLKYFRYFEQSSLSSSRDLLKKRKVVTNIVKKQYSWKFDTSKNLK